jgi:hypothetical protein
MTHPDVTELAALDGGLLLSMTSLIAEALSDDPFNQWRFPNPRLRTTRLRRALELDVRYRLNGACIPFGSAMPGLPSGAHPGPSNGRVRSQRRSLEPTPGRQDSTRSGHFDSHARSIFTDPPLLIGASSSWPSIRVIDAMESGGC